jgi:hypothetical protein
VAGQAIHNIVARVALTTIIASTEAKSTKQSSQIDTRQVKQMTPRTAVGISTNDITRTAIADNIARTAIGVATTVQAKTAE